jgi:protoporphyrinogen oxidase
MIPAARDLPPSSRPMSTSSKRVAVIIGAGPAGLTAAYELLTRTDVVPIVLEASTYMGGIARTVVHAGNRIDIGGHRFFSKSDRVMKWWTERMPIEGSGSTEATRATVQYQQKQTEVVRQAGGPDPTRTDVVMLVRERLSRIYYARKFFDYPLKLSRRTIENLGLPRMARIGVSYALAQVRPRPERSLEDFFINRFGHELYATFLRDYTHKVWGVPCTEIKPEWGAQRVKGLSVSSVLLHALKSALGRDTSIGQKSTETSLIEQFLYPKLGPGQMWELVAEDVRRRGGTILTEHQAVELVLEGERIAEVVVKDERSGELSRLRGDFVFSTMPVRELIGSMRGEVPERVRKVAAGLQYRDFITVGLLLKKLTIRDPATGREVRDNWIYIQEPDVKVGRLQIFNNWSPYLVKDPSTTWVGLEYFCNEGDELWTMSDEALGKLGVAELSKIAIADPADLLDHTVLRMPKTYPSYTGSYDDFHEIRAFTDRVDNLFLIGRNGMHRYNNQDHSMLTAMICVDNILAGERSRANVWDVNTEDDYHETK